MESETENIAAQTKSTLTFGLAEKNGIEKSEKKRTKTPRTQKPDPLAKIEDNLNSELRLIDWQCMRYCSVAIDLSHFFFCCTDDSTRCKMEELLENSYLKTLKNRISELGGDSNMFTENVLHEQMKKYAKFGMGNLNIF